MDTIYNDCKNNATAMNESVIGYTLVVLTQEYENLDQFYGYEPTFSSFLTVFNQTIDGNQYFDKVYSNDQDNAIYAQKDALISAVS